MLGIIFSSFILGLLTPLTAVCVLPLYPGFLSYLAQVLSHHKKNKRFLLVQLGLLVVLGVILFMLFLGILFTLILSVSLTNIVSIISPIAFSTLVLISVLLLFDVDMGKFMPKFASPVAKNPYLSAFLYGLFFGIIIIPCNPGFIAAFLTSALANVSSFFSVIISFFAFGIGIGMPLLLLALLSSFASKKVITFLIKYKSYINRIAGLIMLLISLYYLVFVFSIFG